MTTETPTPLDAQPSARFSLGLTYWPRRTAYGWWRAFDRGEAREDFVHVAALGCDTLRLCLTWEDFQPAAQRLNSGALDALEHALEAAQDAGLRVAVALFPVALGGALWLPEWANEPDPVGQLRRSAQVVLRPAGGPALLHDGRYQPNHAGDLFSDRQVLDAQRYFIREVVGYFGAHPAIAAWQLGEGLEQVQHPASSMAAREWLALMATSVREQRAAAPVLGLISAHALQMRDGPRPEHVAERCDLLGVIADPPQPPSGQRANHSALIAFLHALTAALAERPALVARMGLLTAPSEPGRRGSQLAPEQPGWIADRAYGRPLQAYRGDGEQQATLIETTLDRLQRAGATGAWLASYSDYPPALWAAPPLDRAIRERTLGLVDAEGREKPAAAVVRRFAAERRPVLDVTPPIEVDPERYWRDPQREFARLWREFTTD